MGLVLKTATVLAVSALVWGCTQNEGVDTDAQAYDGIAESETITLVGNDPFWNITISGDIATYTSPENSDGTEFAVARFAGNNGLGYSGELQGEPVQLTVTPGECSDGMSENVFPFTATVSWGDQTFFGCGFTDEKPYESKVEARIRPVFQTYYKDGFGTFRLTIRSMVRRYETAPLRFPTSFWGLRRKDRTT